MIKCLRAVNYVAALACLFGFVDLLRNADASPTPFRETIPLNSQILIQPEYVENLARELEKDSIAAAMKDQDNDKHSLTNSQSRNNDFAFNNNEKFTNQRKQESSKALKKYSDRVIFPAQLIDIGKNKRNFDEIDRTDFSDFHKRNFDEIDHSGFTGFGKKRNFDEIDRNDFSGFTKKRNFDEIDRNGFSGFDKKRNFDEIDRTGFSDFAKKRNFDEIDRSGFAEFHKRNFDEIDRRDLPGFGMKTISYKRSKFADQWNR